MSGCFRNLCPDISGMVVRVFQEYLSGSYKNAVRVLQESSSMGEHQQSLSLDQLRNSVLYTTLVVHINAGSDLVQNDDRRVFQMQRAMEIRCFVSAGS